MAPSSLVVLHGGTGVEVTTFVYLVRFVLHLVAFGGLAVVVHWGMEAARTVRSGAPEASVDSEEASAAER